MFRIRIIDFRRSSYAVFQSMQAKIMDDNQALTSILRTLSKCDYQRDLVSLRNLTFEILTLATNGSDVTQSLPVIVKLLAHPDAFIKRVAGEIISIHAQDNQEISLLSINTLVQDCKDVNPVVRGVSFRTLGSLRTNAVCEVLNASIIEGLADKNGYVRRSAALASLSLDKLSPNAVVDGEIWDILYRHLRDEDSATVASCLCTLEEVCAKEKGIVMSNKLGQYLISNIHTFPSNVQRIMIQFLLKFSPKTKEQMFDNLNELDDNLTKAHSFAAVYCAYELFSYFTQDVSKVKKQLTASAWSSIITNFARERSGEVISASLHYLLSINFDIEQCSGDFDKFVCRDDDSIYLTQNKISILSKMLTRNSADSIFSEFLSCVRTMSLNSVKHLARMLSEVLIKKPDVRKPCVEFLKDLIAIERSEIVNEAMQILPSITSTDADQWKEILSLVEERYHCVSSLEAKTAVLQMIKSHASKMENPAEILEDMFLESYPTDYQDDKNAFDDSDRTQMDHIFKAQLLGAMVQVFLLRPAVIQPMLAKHMELCIRDTDQAVREKALLYYTFLLSKAKPDIQV